MSRYKIGLNNIVISHSAKPLQLKYSTKYFETDSPIQLIFVDFYIDDWLIHCKRKVNCAPKVLLKNSTDAPHR